MIARLFLPGEEHFVRHSRTAQIVDRVMALDEADVARLATRLVADFGHRHSHYEPLLARHASIVSAHLGEVPPLSTARELVLGATFTAEYATEAAALCNPSAVLHPDQSGLIQGQTRLAISLRGIGEGHVSSIGFCAAVVGPGEQFEFEPRPLPISTGHITPASWRRAHLRAVFAESASIDELGSAVLRLLPTVFGAVDLERALADVHHDLLVRPGATETVQLLRTLVASAYRVDFDDDVSLAQRVLMPTAPEESNGMEDARFTRFVDASGGVEFRATYTAYDGREIAPRLLTSTDLKSFRAHRLAGAAARNKGMALFPRLVGGRHLALCRSDGECTSLSSSADGFAWTQPVVLQQPTTPWEHVQVGNCGPPIETDRGWLVFTHGVGAMRTYSMGAMLLDLEAPTTVLGRLAQPLLAPQDASRDGYVPNVVYSCGAVLHDGRVWLPYGIDDSRIGVAWMSVDDLIDAMTPNR